MALFITAYTDGACKGNPGPGGWGGILRAQEMRNGEMILLKEIETSGYALETTNNQMEMMAVIGVLKALSSPAKIKIHSDSKYVIEGITKWIKGWKRRGWTTKDGKPVKNKDLWQQIDNLAQQHDVTWKWVKGHAGNKMNERADRLAVAERNKAMTELEREKSTDVQVLEDA